MSGHHQHNVVAAAQVEVMQLNETSQWQRQRHLAQVSELEAKSIATQITVPTLPHQVRQALRQIGLPVRLFGENLANVRDRLRLELARRHVVSSSAEAVLQEVKNEQTAAIIDEELVTKYTRASPALVEARQLITKYSIPRAADRLERERRFRNVAKHKQQQLRHWNLDTKPVAFNNTGDSKELTLLDQECLVAYKKIRKLTLQGSQYGDSRLLSSMCSATVCGCPMVVTGSWTGSLHLWDASSPVLQRMGHQTMCHLDRIMDVAIAPLSPDNNNESAMVATVSIDKTAKLWKITNPTTDTAMQIDDCNNNKVSSFSITQQQELKGHAARLCRTAFHPHGKHVATTSFDHSWRLWDVETGQELLLQDGHAQECYGIGFHPDGSLCATTDFCGVVHIWDLRTGKSIHYFLGHAARVLNAEFHPNGFQLATAGDDGMIQLWDLRRRKLAESLPAHSGIITRLKFDSTGECLASSSFDGIVKVWSCRNWKMLKELQGHEGKVTSVNFLPNHDVVSCGFDKTLKLWQ
jgi:U4/U6 small nuclear ribonucleoprotein PRP4